MFNTPEHERNILQPRNASVPYQ